MAKDIAGIERREARERPPDDLPSRTDRYDIRQADIHDGLPFLSDDSVDCILTDPPYPHEYLSVYEALSAVAARVLTPGGSCLVMVGQSYLPEILTALMRHLTYHWCLAYLTPGGQSAQLWERKVNTFWKPVLWCVKGRYGGDWVGDVARSDPNDNDKRFHTWGQSESGMADLVRRCSRAGELILDPFCGGGTTGVVSASLNRRFIGCDAERDAVGRTLARCHTDSEETRE